MLFQPFAAKVPAVAGYAASLASPQFLGPLMPSSAFGNAMQAADEFMLVVDPQDPADGRLAQNVADQLSNYGLKFEAQTIRNICAGPYKSVLDPQTVGRVKDELRKSVGPRFTSSLDSLAAGLGSGAHGISISKTGVPAVHPAFEVKSLIRLTNEELVEGPVARAFASAMAMRLQENEKVIAEIPRLQIGPLNGIIRFVLVGSIANLARYFGGYNSASIASIASVTLLLLPPAIRLARASKLRRAMGLGVLDVSSAMDSPAARQRQMTEYKYYADTGESLAAKRRIEERRRVQIMVEKENLRRETGARPA